MSTIKDVAKLAGVSVATVSRVLNKNGYVHEDTLKKVERAIEMLDYKPSTVARSLYNKKVSFNWLSCSEYRESVLSRSCTCRRRCST